MSDKELLELAAKAAGIEVLPFYDGLHDVTNDPNRIGSTWNPLTDDGDALRLAVALNMDILQDPVSSKANIVEVVANEGNVDSKPWAYEVRAPDPYAATRRAIVRAAAAIGKALP